MRKKNKTIQIPLIPILLIFVILSAIFIEKSEKFLIDSYYLQHEKAFSINSGNELKWALNVEATNLIINITPGAVIDLGTENLTINQKNVTIRSDATDSASMPLIKSICNDGGSHIGDATFVVMGNSTLTLQNVKVMSGEPTGDADDLYSGSTAVQCYGGDLIVDNSEIYGTYYAAIGTRYSDSNVIIKNNSKISTKSRVWPAIVNRDDATITIESAEIIAIAEPKLYQAETVTGSEGADAIWNSGKIILGVNDGNVEKDKVKIDSRYKTGFINQCENTNLYGSSSAGTIKKGSVEFYDGMITRN